MTSVQHWRGFWLSLLTAVMWGALPVALVLLLDVLDVITITWVRFAFSAVFIGLMLHRSKTLPAVREYSGRTIGFIVVTVLALIGNFLLYLLGLELLNPEATGVLIQLAPFLLMFGSVVIYGERMGPLEIIGAVILFGGLLLFFNEKLLLMVGGMSGYSLGVLAMLLASLSWSIYGLAQKSLLRSISSRQLTLLIYTGGALCLLVFSHPLAILSVSWVQAMALLFCCLNMVVGYGAFTEAMKVWQAAKVSAVIALAPVFTIIFMAIAVALWPRVFANSELNLWSYLGAVLVVAGSMLAALAKAR